MIKGIYQNCRNLEVQSKRFESVANNLSNVNTSGYKRQLPFSEVLTKEGSIDVKQYTNFTQGELIQTNNPFDIGISGEGYFALKTDNGTEYTRNGKFSISNEGYLINEQGYKVLGEGGDINIFDLTQEGTRDVIIKSNGEIKVGDELVDSLLIVKIQDEQNTVRVSGLNFTADGDNVSIVDEENYLINQGYLEQSNVNPVIEMESMIKMNKDFESAQKLMKYLDQSLGQANEIGKI